MEITFFDWDLFIQYEGPLAVAALRIWELVLLLSLINIVIVFAFSSVQKRVDGGFPAHRLCHGIEA